MSTYLRETINYRHFIPKSVKTKTKTYAMIVADEDLFLHGADILVQEV